MFFIINLILITSLIFIVPIIFICIFIGNKVKNFDIILAFLFVTFCILYGFSNDFLVFFVGFSILIDIFFASLVIIIFKFQENKSIRNLLVSIFLIIFAPIAGYMSFKLYPYQIFYQWVLFHPIEFMEVKEEDGFLQEIDSWGFAGMDSSLMLASSQHYDLTILKDLELWKKNNKIVCNVSKVYKVYPRIYVIFPYTNENCYKTEDIYR